MVREVQDYDPPKRRGPRLRITVLLALFWLIFGLWGGYVPGQPYTYKTWGPNILLFILFVLVGWKVFGPPVR